MGCGPSKPKKLPRTRDPKVVIFRKYDKDHSGKISKKEFADLCMAMGYRLSGPEIDLDMQVLGDKDGNISEETFCKWWSADKRFAKLQWTQDQLKVIDQFKDMFDKYDTDKSGKIDRAEFKELHKAILAAKLTTKPLEQTLAQIDRDGDQMIDYLEYLKFIVVSGRGLNV